MVGINSCLIDRSPVNRGEDRSEYLAFLDTSLWNLTTTDSEQQPDAKANRCHPPQLTAPKRLAAKKWCIWRAATSKLPISEAGFNALLHCPADRSRAGASNTRIQIESGRLFHH